MKTLFLKHTSEVTGVLVIIVLFLAAGYFSQTYFAVLTDGLRAYSWGGMCVYVIGATIATVIAPLSFFPLIPVAVQLWGSVVTALLSIIAWSLGAAIAFLLARRFGQPLVRHFVGTEKVERAKQFLPRRHLFVAVVLLRMVMPVDLLSYALGLLGVMRFWPYMVATVIGITPFAFIFSFAADMQIGYQIGALVVAAVFLLVSFPYLRRRYRQVLEGE